MLGMIGILGGMGPLATADFMRKLTEETPAKKDQDHIPVIAYSVPQIPDRSSSIMLGNDDPLDAMQSGFEALEQMGAECIVIPCNTAHFWYDRLQKENGPVILHIVDMVATYLQERNLENCKLGLLASTGAIEAGIYQERLSALGYDCVIPDEDAQENLVLAAIHAVKSGDLLDGKRRLEMAVLNLEQEGCEAIIMGCTEIPIVLQSTNRGDGTLLVDATQALAQGAVKWHRQSHKRAF